MTLIYATFLLIKKKTLKITSTLHYAIKYYRYYVNMPQYNMFMSFRGSKISINLIFMLNFLIYLFWLKVFLFRTSHVILYQKELQNIKIIFIMSTYQLKTETQQKKNLRVGRFV